MERLNVFRESRPTDGTFLEHYFRYRFATQFVNRRTVLDCACGSGYGTFMLARLAKEVTGIDNSASALEIAGLHWRRANISYLLADAEDLDSLEKSFDVVVSLETLEHLNEPYAFLNGVARCLKPRGCLIVSTPNKDAYRRGLENNPFHTHEFTAAEFIEVLSERFDDVQLFGQLMNSNENETSVNARRAPSLRSDITGALTRHPWGYAMYLLRMKSRFSVVRTVDIRRYAYMLAVCRPRSGKDE